MFEDRVLVVDIEDGRARAAQSCGHNVEFAVPGVVHARARTCHSLLAPAPNLSAALQSLAERHVGAILEALDYVGVLAVEFFEKDSRLYANEMAPRVHNSGHWTIEGARTSQFENHLRAILGRPLGATGAVDCSAMVNLIGTMPDPAIVLAIPDAPFHDYGKSPRPGRKLGHVTLRAEDAASLQARLARLREIVP